MDDKIHIEKLTKLRETIIATTDNSQPTEQRVSASDASAAEPAPIAPALMTALISELETLNKKYQAQIEKLIAPPVASTTAPLSSDNSINALHFYVKHVTNIYNTDGDIAEANQKIQTMGPTLWPLINAIVSTDAVYTYPQTALLAKKAGATLTAYDFLKIVQPAPNKIPDQKNFVDTKTAQLNYYQWQYKNLCQQFKSKIAEYKSNRDTGFFYRTGLAKLDSDREASIKRGEDKMTELNNNTALPDKEKYKQFRAHLQTEYNSTTQHHKNISSFTAKLSPTYFKLPPFTKSRLAEKVYKAILESPQHAIHPQPPITIPRFEVRTMRQYPT